MRETIPATGAPAGMPSSARRSGPSGRERRRVHRAARREDALLRDAEALDERARVRLAHATRPSVRGGTRRPARRPARERARRADGAHDPRRPAAAERQRARARGSCEKFAWRTSTPRARAPRAAGRPAGSGAGRPSTRARGPRAPRAVGAEPLDEVARRGGSRPRSPRRDRARGARARPTPWARRGRSTMRTRGARRIRRSRRLPAASPRACR